MIVLGLSAEHDAGAAVVIDGRVRSAINEERLSRRKLHSGMPRRAVAAALETAGVDVTELDAVAVASFLHVPELDWEQKANFLQVAMEAISRAGLAPYLVGHVWGVELACLLLRQATRLRAWRIRGFLRELGITAPLTFVDHHQAHLAKSYYTSGWDRCVALSLDAQGDGYCSKLALCDCGGMKVVHRIPFFHSPGYYYGYVTALLGFAPRRDGKVTGLAAYGDAEQTLGVFRRRICYDPRRMRFDNRGRYWLAEISALRQQLAGFAPEDIAAGIQTHLEQMVTAFVQDSLRRLGQRHARLALSGGVFANVKLNQRLAALPEVAELYVAPHMGDGGLALGSALEVAGRLAVTRGSRPSVHRMDHVFLGTTYGPERIRRDLEAAGLRYSHREDIHTDVATRIARGEIVARFTGAMEFGPRALGHRSVLVAPTDPNLKALLNQRLKRTEFMPFAPAVLREDAAAFFHGLDKVARAIPFMTVTCDVTDRCRSEAAGVVHVDGTARPQLVAEEHSPDLYRILLAYKRLTGLPLLVNTSFNIHEEPIVCTPADAVAAFREGKLDALAMGDYLVER